jgi:hypothetical protein
VLINFLLDNCSTAKKYIYLRKKQNARKKGEIHQRKNERFLIGEKMKE